MWRIYIRDGFRTKGRKRFPKTVENTKSEVDDLHDAPMSITSTPGLNSNRTNKNRKRKPRKKLNKTNKKGIGTLNLVQTKGDVKVNTAKTNKKTV